MKWITVYNKPYIGFTLEKAGYFDERPLVTTSITQIIAFITMVILCFYSWWALLLLPLTLIGWGKAYISLPIYTGIESSESPMWGAYYSFSEQCLFVYKGSNGRGGYEVDIYYSPFSYEHCCTQVLLKNGKLIPEKILDLFTEKGEDSLLPKCRVLEERIYTDYDGTQVPVKLGGEIVTYKRRIGSGKKYSNRALLLFSEEVGKEKGTWKGGVTFINTVILEGETIDKLLMRLKHEL